MMVIAAVHVCTAREHVSHHIFVIDQSLKVCVNLKKQILQNKAEKLKDQLLGVVWLVSGVGVSISTLQNQRLATAKGQAGVSLDWEHSIALVVEESIVSLACPQLQ